MSESEQNQHNTRDDTQDDVDIGGADITSESEVELPATGDPASYDGDSTLGNHGGTAEQAGGAG